MTNFLFLLHLAIFRLILLQELLHLAIVRMRIYCFFYICLSDVWFSCRSCYIWLSYVWSLLVSSTFGYLAFDYFFFLLHFFRPQNDCRCRDRIRQKSARCHYSNYILPECFCTAGTPNLHGCTNSKVYQKLSWRVCQKVPKCNQPWWIPQTLEEIQPQREQLALDGA